MSKTNTKTSTARVPRKLIGLLSAVVFVVCSGCGTQLAGTPEAKLAHDRKAQVRQEQTERLQRKAAAVRARFVASALSRKGPLDNSAHLVPALVLMLRDKDAEVQRSAITALGNLGPQAKPAIPILTDLLRDRLLHADAAVALKKIQASG